MSKTIIDLAVTVHTDVSLHNAHVVITVPGSGAGVHHNSARAAARRALAENAPELADRPMSYAGEVNNGYDRVYLVTLLGSDALNPHLITADAMTNDGGTYALTDGLMAVKMVSNSGYMVSVPGLEETTDRLSPRAVSEYVTLVKDLAGGAYLGIWLDGGTWYLDTSVWVESFDEAARLGIIYDQLGIYDLANGQTLHRDGDTYTAKAAA